MAERMLPTTSGELLKEEFLKPMGIFQYRLAQETGIPAQRIGQIVLGRRRVTADTDSAPLPILRLKRRLLAEGSGGLRRRDYAQGDSSPV